MTSAPLVRRLALPVYLPILAAYLGLGMLVVALPLYLTDLGLGLGTISIVLAAPGAGAAVGAMPIGELMARFGVTAVARWSLLAWGLVSALLGATGSPWLLSALMFFAGLATAAFLLSRQTLVTLAVPTLERGRAMSYMGGAFRVAFLIGPVLGGALADQIGFRATFIVAGAMIAVAVLAINRPFSDDAPIEDATVGILDTLRTHRKLLFTGGTAQLLVMLVRDGRLVVLPLLGAELDLTSTQTGALVTVSTAADLVLFPVAGWTMDRFGRLWAMMPAFSLVTVGLVLLGFAESATALVVAGAVIGIGNGLASGTMLTLASDLAPTESAGSFLAGMAAIRNLGRIVGPLAVGLAGDLVGLSGSAFMLAAVMLTAMAWIFLILGETRDHQPPPSPREF